MTDDPVIWLCFSKFTIANICNSIFIGALLKDIIVILSELVEKQHHMADKTENEEAVEREREESKKDEEKAIFLVIY